MSREGVLRQALLLWALAFAAIVVVSLLAPPPWAKVTAVVAFLYLPLAAMRGTGEDTRDYGVTLAHWRTDLLLALGLLVVVAPLFVLGYEAWLGHLPGHAPGGPPPGLAFRPRVPAGYGWSNVVDEVFVTALPEEFFYRGWLQTRLKRVWPGGARIAGVAVGPAFLLTAALFAVGHLAIFQASRLAVFFPALLFGWLRERTGTVVGSTLFHAGCNILAKIVAASVNPLWDAR
ncbi:MAG TPA: MXAN_2755 family glutamic-type intramembrane protease [Myxococcaceae bacterium]|nr:MXAN_2755 family glutamic-type intramembrane protease [Myxococcaceae bacterium]